MANYDLERVDSKIERYGPTVVSFFYWEELMSDNKIRRQVAKHDQIETIARFVKTFSGQFFAFGLIDG